MRITLICVSKFSPRNCDTERVPRRLRGKRKQHVIENEKGIYDECKGEPRDDLHGPGMQAYRQHRVFSGGIGLVGSGAGAAERATGAALANRGGGYYAASGQGRRKSARRL